MPISQTDESFMRNALALAIKGKGSVSPNPIVGAVIVNDGKVVGRGYHARAGEDHAEVVALKEAADQSADGTLYCTLEPCCHYGRTPPCVGAIIEAGISRVVIAQKDPSEKVSGKGVEELEKAGVSVEVGCLQQEARELNEFFNIFHEKQRPFVTAKWAMTLDGRTGTDTNHSRWITNEASRKYVHELRADHDAIMIGIGTILADDPMLDVRLDLYKGRQPLRIIIDGDLSIPRRARVLRSKKGGNVVLVTTSYASQEAVKALEEDGHRVVVLPGKRRLVEMEQIMIFMAKEEILSVLAEGGRQIHSALLRAGYVDKVVAFVAPSIIGGKLLRSPVEDLGKSMMDQAIQLKRTRWIQFREDICLEGYISEI